MELRQIKYIIKIAECGTMLKASEALCISQSGLTRSLKTSEEELGVPLFDRKKNRLYLNEYGKMIVEEGRKIIEEAESLENRVQEKYLFNTSCMIGACAPSPLWAVRTSLKKVMPDTAVHYEIHSSENELLQLFMEHRYSAIILNHPMKEKNLSCFKICEENLFISVNKEHPLAKVKQVTFSEMNGLNFLEDNETGYWHDVCVRNMPESHLIVENDLTIYKILQEQSSLITFRTSCTIPRFHLYEDRHYVPIADENAKLTFYFICQKSDYKKYEKIRDAIKNVDWIHFREEDYDI